MSPSMTSCRPPPNERALAESRTCSAAHSADDHDHGSCSRPRDRLHRCCGGDGDSGDHYQTCGHVDFLDQHGRSEVSRHLDLDVVARFSNDDSHGGDRDAEIDHDVDHDDHDRPGQHEQRCHDDIRGELT